MNGGDVIGSGGYGCVFKPSLACSSDNKKLTNNQNITKLMIKKYATAEYEIIVDFKNRLHGIKNYDNYFLLKDITKCDNLKKMSKQDLKGYSSRCKPLIKRDITAKNINSSLDKLSAITMPYGGIELNDFFQRNINNYSAMRDIFEKLSNLVKDGIIQMNNRYVYHGDIKASNILVDDNHVRLIDWGLAFHHEKGDTHINHDSTGRPFQFNVPPTCVILNSDFEKKYTTYLQTTPSPSYDNVITFLDKYLAYWNTQAGFGSLDLVNYIYEGILAKNNKVSISDAKYVGNTIKHYIANVVHKYTTKNKTIDLKKYYHDVYLKNLDLWGAVMSCIPVFEMMYQSRESLNTIDLMVLDELFAMFSYLIKKDITHLDYKVIVNHLKQISTLYGSAQQNSNVGFMEKTLKESRPRKSPSLLRKNNTKKTSNIRKNSYSKTKLKTRKNTPRTTRTTTQSTRSKMRKIGKKYF